MSRRSRRRVLRLTGCVGAVGLAGCTELLTTDEDEPDGSSETEHEESDPVDLSQSIPDPERHVDDSRGRASYPRRTGTVRVDTTAGTLHVEGPADGRYENAIVAVAGYLAADGLRADDSWGGVVDAEAGYLGTNATWKRDLLTFGRGTFEGVALRASPAVTLVVDDETVAEHRDRVRYRPGDGVFTVTPDA